MQRRNSLITLSELLRVDTNGVAVSTDLNGGRLFNLLFTLARRLSDDLAHHRKHVDMGGHRGTRFSLSAQRCHRPLRPGMGEIP
jgi:hypothetical protein